MVENACAAEMTGECAGNWCKNPETGGIDKKLMDACKWPEKLLVTVTSLPPSLERAVSCGVSDIAKLE